MAKLTRLNMNVPEDLIRELDQQAARYGVTRTAYVTMALSQKLQSEQITKSLPELQQMLERLQGVVERQENEKNSAPLRAGESPAGRAFPYT